MKLKFRALNKKGKWVYYGTGLKGTVDHLDLDENTESQYTGLKDRNGKEIYEGDIAKHGDSIVQVKWDNKAQRYMLFASEWCTDNGWLTEFKAGLLEVIGNIYENPELVKE